MALQCEALTKSGSRCRNEKVSGSFFCARHRNARKSIGPDIPEITSGEVHAKKGSEEKELDTDWAIKEAQRLDADVDVAAEAAKWPRGRDLGRDEIARILEDHHQWHESKGKSGKRGDLSYANLIWQKAPGLWFFCGNMRGMRFFDGSLKGAFLSHVDLRGASLNNSDLRDATLTDSDLRGAYLRETKLSGTHLDGSDLSHAVMDGALLEGEGKSEEEIAGEEDELRDDFGDEEDDPGKFVEHSRQAASLERTRLNHAVLANARLSDVTGLRAEQLGGADLTNAKLPPEVAKFDLLGNVAEVSKVASATFITQIGASFYSMITIATTTVGRLGESTALTKLPILGTEIPIITFFVAAPFVLAGVYAYFHLYLLRLWRLVAALPARFPDGRSLDEKAFPWLLTSLIELYMPLLHKKRRPLWWVEVAISVVTAWLVVPASVTMFLLAFVNIGDTTRIIVLGLLLIGTVVFGVITFLTARRYLRGDLELGRSNG